MTPHPFVPLSDLERDALAELSNIAMAKAANSLRQMIENEVLLSVPSVEILTTAPGNATGSQAGQSQVGCRAARLRWRILGPGDANLSGTE